MTYLPFFLSLSHAHTHTVVYTYKCMIFAWAAKLVWVL